MKNLIFISFLFLTNIVLSQNFYNFQKSNKVYQQNVYRELLHSNKYYSKDFNNKNLDSIESQDRPDLAWKQDYLKRIDPSLGYVPYERKIQAINIAQQILSQKTAIPGTNWTERGPNNVGGRTRALMFDPNDGANNYKKVWAGGVTGGLWYNNDITTNTSWNKVNDFWDNIAVTCITFDPSNTNIFYAGTGEGWGTGAARGAGIWKTTDGGSTWVHLSSTDNSDFYYVQKIAVTSTGRVMSATAHGLYISDDNGNSWTQKIADFTSDIEIAANGDIYVGQGRIYYTGKIFKSTDGGDSFTDITPSGGSPERVEIGLAPSNSSVVYAIASNGHNVEWFKKSTNGGNTWTDITIPNYLEQSCSYGSDDFTRGQAWYDLIITVKPNDANTVLVGGIDINKSTDGGNSWSTVSYWTGSCHPYVHADQHACMFRPGTNNEAIFGCDGGVFYSQDIGNSSSPSFDERNKDYNVTQFYSCAIKNISGANYFLAGAQDNGSHKFENPGINSTTTVTGGDGAFCFIDQDNSDYQITSYVYNSWYRSTNGGNSFSSISSDNTGKFINPADYDNNADILYAADDADKIYRISGISGSPSINTKTVGGDALGGDQASHIRVSDYSANVLFVGTETGNIYRVSNANTNPVSTDIDPSGTLPSGNISCIEIGASDNDLLVTFSNYGIVSVWETHDGGNTWINKEGNLPDMPVNWALYNPNDRNQVLLATDVGVWSTSDISVASPDWSPTSTGLANVRCDMLQIRNADLLVAIATYGRGLFTSDVFESPLPVADFTANQTTACTQDTVKFTDYTTKNPNSWSWTITPSSVSFVNGTNSNSQNPEVIFNASGTYTIKLVASNTAGSDTVIKTNYITVTNNCNYAMSDDTVYTCDGYFYDSGLNSADYQNDEDYVMTFYPTTSGAKIEANFTSFSVENETNCNYDYLRIYDGPNTASSQIGGKYCGTNSPGTITATNAQGALTFEWHSDGGVTDAGWEARIQCVGNIPPTANFTVDATSTCDGSVNFTDLSTGGPSSWNWDFGDGGTSTQQNPSYTYSSDGIYTVTLIVSNSSGSDTLVKTNYITVNTPTAPTTTDSSRCDPGTVTLLASGGGTLEWYDNATSGNLINTGTSYTTPVLSTTTTYYVENHEFQTSQYNTPHDNTFGGGNYYTNSNSHYLIFDALNDFKLISVKVYANGAGNREIVLRNNAGDTLQSIITNFPDGESRITLNWDINTGTDYELVLNANPNVYRNSSGASYPYTVQDVVSITGSSYSSSYYYYFYDWEVAKECVSSRTSVTAYINSPVTPSITISASDTNICSGTNVTFTANASNGGSSPAYQWQLNGSNTGSNSATYSNSGLANGDVVSCILTSNETCVTSNTANSNNITMTVNTIPSTPIASDTEACFGSSIPPLYSTGINVEWYSNSSLTNLVNTGNTFVTGQTNAGTYTYYVVENNNGCRSSITTSTLSIIEAPVPTVNYNWICGSGSVNLIANGQGTIYWYNTAVGGNPLDSGNVFNTPVISNTTNYYAESKVNGCISNSRGLGLAIVYNQPIANFNFTVNNLDVSFTNNSVNSDTYLWDFGDNITSSVINPLHTYLQQQIYNVMLVAENPCYVDTIYKIIDLSPVNIFTTSYNDIVIYPNPASTYLKIKSYDKHIFNIKIYDIYGRRITQLDVNNTNVVIIDVKMFPKGIYFIKAQTNKGNFVKKIIKN